MTSTTAEWQFGPEDPRSPAERLADLRSVQEQVIAVAREADSGLTGRRVLESVRARHADRDDLVSIGEVPNKHGGTTLAVETELLIRTQDHTDSLRRMFDEQGLVVAPEPRRARAAFETDPLQSRVTRLTGSDTSLERAARLASSLRLQGIQVSVNHVTPMGAQWKSVAGPEHTQGAAPSFRPPSGKGSPAVRVVVLDTGVWAGDRPDWLKGLPTKDNSNVEDLYQQGDRLHNGAGHGSFCAGIVQQVAPDAEVVVRRVLDVDGLEDEVTVCRHMVRAVEEGLAAGQHVLLNLSLGAESADDERPVAFSVALERIEELQRDKRSNPSDREAMVVAAAGNFGHDRPCYPAAFPSVVAVAALTQGLLPAGWSSRGAWVDVCTIGEGVRSTFVPGEESPEFDPTPETFREGAWALWTGTSFAAPQVAGAIAHVAQAEGVGLTEAKWMLLRDARDVPLYGKVVEILERI